MSDSYNSSPLKWAGSKQKALKHLLPIIGQYEFKTLIEPFIGAANVSLNVEADEYIWNDLNEDLFLTYKVLLDDISLGSYLLNSELLFKASFGSYSKFRDMFNKRDFTCESMHTSLFQYLNKHGFNGLCRYNQKGGFNVPVGTVTPNPKRVPIEQCMYLHNRHKDNTKLHNTTFENIFDMYRDEPDSLIYCDPPYVALKSDFKYTKEGFNLDAQQLLKGRAKEASQVVMISNHWTEFTKELYSDADHIHVFDVQRTISCDGGGREKVQECVAIYE